MRQAEQTHDFRNEMAEIAKISPELAEQFARDKNIGKH